MRVSLTLIATTLFSSMAIAAPGFEKENTGNSVFYPGNSGVNRQVDTLLYADINPASKRGIDGETPGNLIDFHITTLFKTLTGYITSEKIDYGKFEEYEDDNLEELEYAENLSRSDLPEGAFGGELRDSRRFYEAFKNASETKDRFHGCDYTGSDLVEKMMELNLRILALNDFDEMGESQVERYKSKFSELEAKVTDLENTKEEMIPGIQKIFKEQTEIAKASLKLLKSYEESEENTSSTSGKKKDCPAI